MAPPRPSPSLSSTLSPPDASAFFLGDLAPVLHSMCHVIVNATRAQHAASIPHAFRAREGGQAVRDLVELELLGEGARGGHAPTASDALAAAPGDLAAAVQDPKHVGRQEGEQRDPEGHAVEDPPAGRLCDTRQRKSGTASKERTRETEGGNAPHFQ